MLLLDLFDENRYFLVFSSFFLEPDPDDPGAESSHFHQLVLHEGVWPWIRRIAGPQGVKLLLIQHGPHPRCLRVVSAGLMVGSSCTTSSPPTCPTADPALLTHHRSRPR